MLFSIGMASKMADCTAAVIGFVLLNSNLSFVASYLTERAGGPVSILFTMYFVLS